jgi:hypothetical protein
VGWIFLLVSIVIAIWVIKVGIEIYYEFFNNLQSGLDEFLDKTLRMENLLGILALAGFGSFLLGICSILKFIYLNL